MKDGNSSIYDVERTDVNPGSSKNFPREVHSLA